ncbi:hypothetical protein [Mucilaginibacter sp.]|jgi:hypothetical protein|uniref:hypothetical protein n=1 Tax=Mucilaginibacter sp. TaxID=1882438 RepID=UPI00356AEF44
MTCNITANYNVYKLLPRLGVAIKNNGIGCHMPARPSNLIQVKANGSKLKVPYLVRTHHIAIYLEETRKIRAFINSHN